MNTLVNIMNKQASMKLTENGAVAFSTTGTATVDLFSTIGALRPREENEIIQKFDASLYEHPDLTIKMLFYAGDIREGLGERRTFRICLHRLAELLPEVVVKNIKLIPEYNRWDSIFALIGTDAESAMWQLIKETLVADIMNLKKNKNVSLLAKWMPSENTSSLETRKLAKKARTNIGLSSKQYRKTLSALRKHINIVERQISANKWDEIDYETVPSNAMLKYRAAFFRHDEERMNEYISAVQSGEKKINSSVLYPYDLVGKYSYPWYSDPIVDPVVEEQWKALPNYVNTEDNILIMADVSISMYGRPIDSSVGLAIYFAERNHGDFKNLYMTFSSNPHCIQINPKSTLAEKVHYVMHTDVGYSTNFDAAFKYLYDMCVDGLVSANDLPSALVVISDMEIDRFGRDNVNYSFVDKWEREFSKAGYKLPKLIFWNVEARKDTFLSQNPNVLYVGGQSVSTFKNLMGSLDGKTAFDLMIEVLDSPRYAAVITE